MQRISVNLTNDCDGNKNYALQKPVGTNFLTVIGNAKLRLSFVICRVDPRLWPKAPDFAL